MKKTTPIFALLLTVFVLSGCSSVKTLLNQHKVSSADEQRAALKENSHSLSQLNTCDFSLNIGRKDFDTILIPAFNTIINGKEIRHVTSYSIDKLSATTDDEQINFTANFKMKLDTLNASIEGNLIGTISFAFRNDSMILFPAFKYIHISSLTYKKTGRFERKAIATFINLVFDLFIERLNGYMISKTPAIPLNLIDREVAPQELVNDANTIVTLSKPLKISTPIAVSSCLIDKSGIHILGSFESAQTDSSQKTNGEFSLFQNDFSNKRKNCFVDLPDDKKTFMVLSKNAFSKIFNTALNNETININYASDNAISDKSDKNIKIDLDEIHCGDIHLDPPQLHVVPPCKSPFGDCNKHCGKYDPVCKGKELACKAANVTWDNTVGIACRATQLAENIFNDGVNFTWEANRRAAILSCEVVKRGLIVVLTSKVSIGDIHTTVASSCNASGSISGISISNDMSKFALSLTANANAPIHTTFGFTPEGPAGHLVCALSFDHPYDCSASASKTLNNEQVTSSFENATDGLLLLKFKTNPVDFNINMKTSPLALMTRDIPTLINCPLVGFGVGLGNIVKGVNDIFSDGSFGNNIVNAIMNGTYNYTLKEKSFNLPIKTVQVKLLDNHIPLSPIAKTNYIGFFNSLR